MKQPLDDTRACKKGVMDIAKISQVKTPGETLVKKSASRSRGTEYKNWRMRQWGIAAINQPALQAAGNGVC
jgi:hypothetical protein